MTLSYEEFCDRIDRIRKARHIPILKCYYCGTWIKVGGDFHMLYNYNYIRKCVRCNSQKYLECAKDERGDKFVRAF